MWVTILLRKWMSLHLDNGYVWSAKVETIGKIFFKKTVLMEATKKTFFRTDPRNGFFDCSKCSVSEV